MHFLDHVNSWLIAGRSQQGWFSFWVMMFLQTFKLQAVRNKWLMAPIKDWLEIRILRFSKHKWMIKSWCLVLFFISLVWSWPIFYYPYYKYKGWAEEQYCSEHCSEQWGGWVSWWREFWSKYVQCVLNGLVVLGTNAERENQAKNTGWIMLVVWLPPVRTVKINCLTFRSFFAYWPYWAEAANHYKCDLKGHWACMLLLLPRLRSVM